MNERIRELAEQATIITSYQYQTWGDRTGIDYKGQFDKEKFAELLVLEMIRYFNEDYVRNFDLLWREDLSEKIKEHFGVEE